MILEYIEIIHFLRIDNCKDNQLLQDFEALVEAKLWTKCYLYFAVFSFMNDAFNLYFYRIFAQCFLQEKRVSFGLVAQR